MLYTIAFASSNPGVVRAVRVFAVYVSGRPYHNVQSALALGYVLQCWRFATPPGADASRDHQPRNEFYVGPAREIRLIATGPCGTNFFAIFSHRTCTRIADHSTHGPSLVSCWVRFSHRFVSTIRLEPVFMVCTRARDRRPTNTRAPRRFRNTSLCCGGSIAYFRSCSLRVNIRFVQTRLGGWTAQ